jgi:hypothetical protein
VGVGLWRVMSDREVLDLAIGLLLALGANVWGERLRATIHKHTHPSTFVVKA